MSNLPAPPTRNPPKRSNPPPPPLTKAQKRAPIRPPSIPVQQKPEQQNPIEITEKKEELIQEQKVVPEQHEGQAINSKNKANKNVNHEQEKNINNNKESINQVQQTEIPVYAAEQNYPKQDILETQDLDGSNINHPNIKQDTQKTGQSLVRPAPPANLPKKTIPPPSRTGINKKMGNAPRPPPPMLKSKIESSQEIKEEEKYENEGKQTKANEQPVLGSNQVTLSQTKNNIDQVKKLAQVLPNVNQNKNQKQVQTVPEVKRTIKTGPPPINTKKAPKVPQIPAYKDEKNMQLQSLKQSNTLSMVAAPTQKSAPQNELLSSIQSPTPNRQLYPPQSATLPSQQKNQAKMPEIFQPMSPTQQIQAILGASNLTPKYANLKNKLKDFSMKKQKLLESSSEDSNSQICSQTYSQMDAKREANKGKDKQARGLYTVQSVKQAKWEDDQKPIMKQILGEQLENQFGNDRILRTESQDPTLRNFDKQQLQSQKNTLQRKLSEKKLPKPDMTIANKMPTSVIVGPLKKPPHQKIQQIPNKFAQRQTQQQMVNEQKEQQKWKQQINKKQEIYNEGEISYENVEKVIQNTGNGIKSKIDESRNQVIEELDEQNSQSPTKNISEIKDKNYLGSSDHQQQVEFSNPILQHDQNENQSMNEDKKFKRPAIKPVPPPKKTGKSAIRSVPVPVPAPPAPRSILPTKNTEQTNLDSQKMRTQLELIQNNNSIEPQAQNKQVSSSHTQEQKIVTQRPAPKAKPIQKQQLIKNQRHVAEQSSESAQKYSGIGTTSIDEMCRLLEQFRYRKQQYLRKAQQLSQLCECNRQKQNKKVVKVNQLLHRLQEQNIKLKSMLTTS